MSMNLIQSPYPAVVGGIVPAIVGQPLLYTGTGSAQSISGAGISPELAIIRRRNANGGTLSGTSWRWIDNVRGMDKTVQSDSNGQELTDALLLTSFDANGFTLGTSAAGNLSGGDFLALALQRVAGAFDIVTYTGTGVAHTEAHGLGAIPELIFVKNRTNAIRDWAVYAAAIGNSNRLILNGTGGTSGSGSSWNSTTPTSTVFTVGTNALTNENGSSFVAYLFAPLNPGVAIGTYTGDGNANGPSVTINFKAHFVIIKRTDSAGSWITFDNLRDPTSPHNTYQRLNLAGTNADLVTTNTAGGLDMTTTAFQSIDSAAADINISGATYLYLAVA